jgi:hypothetical protein
MALFRNRGKCCQTGLRGLQAATRGTTPLAKNCAGIVRLNTMADDLPPLPERPEGAVPVSPHLLTWWFGLMAAGGVGFGLHADDRPFGNGVLAHPLVVLALFVLAGLTTLRFLHARPVLQLISARCLAAGATIAVACFFLGGWFGANLIHMP